MTIDSSLLQRPAPAPQPYEIPIPDPVGDAQRLQALRNAAQQGQLNTQQGQLNTLDLQSRQLKIQQEQTQQAQAEAIHQVLTDPSATGSDGHFSDAAIQKVSAINPTLGDSLAKSRDEGRAAANTAATSQRGLADTKRKEMQSRFGVVRDLPPEQQGAAYADTVAGLEADNIVPKGKFSPTLPEDPAQALGRLTALAGGPRPAKYFNAPAGSTTLDENNPIAPPIVTPEKKPMEEKISDAWLKDHPITNGHPSTLADFNEANKNLKPSEFEATLADFGNHPELVKKFGAGPIGFDKYKAAQKLDQAAAGRAQILSSLAPAAGEIASPEAKAIAEYRLPPISPRSMATPAGKLLMDQVMAANPEYDGTQFPNRSATRKAFTSGTQGQQIIAMNTVLGHMDQMGPAIDALNHGNFVPGNEAYDTVRTMFGSNAVTNFDNIKGAVAGELGKVLKGVVTDSEIARVDKNIRDAGSPDQLRGAIDTNIPLIGSKLAALDYQYHQAMGAKDPFSALSPDSQAVLTKHGFDPAHPTLTKGAGSTSGAKPITEALILANMRANGSLTRQQVIDNLTAAGYSKPQ